jgi:hypothetical protein
MIKLISQFDNEKMRASVATPTCGPCCSCCCCCIVTTLTSSIITARNLGRLTEPQISSQPSPQVKPSKLQARLFGFFLLPLALGAGFLVLFSGGENFVFALTIAATIFGAGLYIFHNKYGLPKKTALLIFFVTVAALVGEFFAWLFILLGGDF